MTQGSERGEITVRTEDAVLLIAAWQRSTGLKANAGIDPVEVNRAADRITDLIVDAAIDDYIDSRLSSSGGKA